MPIHVACACGHKFRVDDSFAGQEGPCPSCGNTTRLDGPRVAPFDVFISYSSKDNTIADAAVAVLEQRGLRCWVAPRNIIAGKEWSESIIEGIEKSRLMVLIFSQHSNQSQQVVREVERAVAKGIPIIPFRIEDVPASKSMEYFISYHHWLDAYQPPLEKHLDKLADMAGQLLDASPPSKEAAEDAKSLAGKLNAAVNTLLARDKRTRLLVAAAAAVVVALLIVAASAYSLREPVASVGVIEAKGKAEVGAAGTVDFDPGDGVDLRQARIQERLRAAEALYDDKQFSKAEALYREVIAEAASLTEFDARRYAALDKKHEMDAAREVAVEIGAQTNDPANWGLAVRHEAEAERAYAAFEYERAAKAWTQATAALSLATENSQKAEVPKLKAIACLTSIAVANKWWYEKLRPPETAAVSQPALGPGLGGLLPGGRSRGFGGLGDSRPAPADWPPYQAAISQGLTFLELEARPNLGIDEALIDRLVAARDVAMIDATSAKAVEQLSALHGKDVEMAYRLGTNVAKLQVMCELGAAETRISATRPVYSPTKGDIMWSTDYILHRATVCGLPQDLLDRVLEIRRLYDEVTDGQFHGEVALGYAFRKMDEKTEALHEKYFATLEAATRLFAEAKPPADPPEFPLRSEDTNEAMQALERHNAYFLTDLTRWDRPPISLIFQVERSLIPLDPDPIVEKIVRFTELRRLGVHNLQLEDRHLEQLSDLKELGELWLGSDRITVEGMAHVARLPRLERLYLYGTMADAQTLKPLAAAKLKEFGASEKDFDDESAALAKNWSDLEALYLGNTSLSDTGLSHVAGLPRLKILELADTKITDASAPLLGKMQKLETLNLEGTALTDAAIPELKKLKKLKALDVSGTQITQEGAESLKEALPGCEISGN